MVQGDVWASFSGAILWQVVALRSDGISFQRDTWASDTKILARDEANMHGRGLATSANMTQTVCDTIFLHSCAMQVRASSANKQQQAAASVIIKASDCSAAMEPLIGRPPGATICRCSRRGSRRAWRSIHRQSTRPESQRILRGAVQGSRPNAVH